MINVKDNILSIDELKKAMYFIDSANWTYGWPSNKDMPYGHWNVDFTKTAKNNPTDVANILPPAIAPIWQQVNKSFFNGHAKLTRCYANRHTFGTEGYIHTDTEREEDQTCVVYMDSIWNANWGGETSFYSKDLKEIVKSVMPQFGRTAVFPGNIPHCAKPVSRVCPQVRTTLMFKVTINPRAVYSSEELLVPFLDEIGANKLPHKRGSLADHLIRTYHLLKSAGAGDIVALAGGLHSVYGTNAFKKKVLDVEDTRIRVKFGPEVDRIVRLYSASDRPKCLETPDGTLDELDLFLLRSIECANLYDQEELDPQVYPNLYEFAMQFKR
jgi:SM-20-related protein